MLLHAFNIKTAIEYAISRLKKTRDGVWLLTPLAAQTWKWNYGTHPHNEIPGGAMLLTDCC